MKSMDAKEYQELKQRCRKTRAGRRIGLFSTVLAVLIVFVLGVTGGLLISAKRVTKTMRAADTDALRRSATDLTPAPSIPISAEKAPSNQIKGAGTNSLPAGARSNAAKDVTQTQLKSKSPPRAAVDGGKRIGRLAVTLRVSPQFPRFHSSGKAEDTMAYASRVQSLIELHKVDTVTVTRQKGAAPCTVVCIVKRDGSIKHAEVVKSSGDAVLDSAALRSVRNAGRFPAVPESIPGDEISFDLPVAFRKTP